MHSVTARIPTRQGAKYIQQLCKHWAHKLKVDWTADRGIVRFDGATATMTAEPEALLATVEAADPDVATRIGRVLASHLDRFAFREAPLPIVWSETA